MTTTATQKLTAFLAKSSDKHLAATLELIITGETKDVTPLSSLDLQALRGIENHVRTEARKRVGETANAAADAERAAFNAKWGLCEDMTEGQMDAIFDTIPDEEFLPGEWYYLVQALRAR